MSLETFDASEERRPALIVLGGLPGVGKTAIARELVLRRPMAYVRIDAIEQALVASNALAGEVGPAGYVVAYEIARSNLAAGIAVIADSVNPLAATRDAWRAVASSTSADLVEVEVICSDAAEHRRRVESRIADIPGHVLPTWEAASAREYEPWASPRLVIDSALVRPVDAAALIIRRLAA